MTDEKQSKWKRKKQRRGFTVQLVVGEDDNLIQYLENLQSGDRAHFMRAALYRGMKVKLPPAPQAVNYQALQQALTETHYTLQTELSSTQQALQTELESIKQHVEQTAQTAQTAQQELTSVKDAIKRDMQQELAAVKTAIKQSQSVMPAGAIDPDTAERIDYLYRWLEDITAKLPVLVDDRIARLVPDGFIAGAQPGADFIGETEPAQQVDPAELEKRGRRIKAATW